MPKGCASPGCRIRNPGRRLIALPNGSSRTNGPEGACSLLPPERACEDVRSVRFVRLPGIGVSEAAEFSGKHPIVEAAAAVRPCGAGGLWRAKSCRTRTRSPKLSRPSRRCNRSRDMSNAGSSRIWFSTARSQARRDGMSCTSSARLSLATPSNPNRRCGGSRSSLRAGATPTTDAAADGADRFGTMITVSFPASARQQAKRQPESDSAGQEACQRHDGELEREAVCAE